MNFFFFFLNRKGAKAKNQSFIQFNLTTTDQKKKLHRKFYLPNFNIHFNLWGTAWKLSKTQVRLAKKSAPTLFSLYVCDNWKSNLSGN